LILDRIRLAARLSETESSVFSGHTKLFFIVSLSGG
jgi:hypothetical protein